MLLGCEKEVEEIALEVLQAKVNLSTANTRMSRMQGFLRGILNDADAQGDVVFEVDGERIPAHKCILANR